MKKLKNLAAKAATVGTAVATTVGMTFCDMDVNDTAKKIVDFVFNAMLVGGLVMIAMGVVQIAKAVSEGEAAPPNAVPKALGFVLAGIVMCAIKSLLKAIGVPVDNIKLI